MDEMKLKDYVTLGNLAAGLAAALALLHHLFDLACYLVLLGFAFDVLDGLVARITRQKNRFGGELDNLCDLVTYSIAPALIVYYAFHEIAHWHIAAAAALAFVPLAAGTIRAARYNVRRADCPGFFIGLPRPGFAFVIIAVLQSSLFASLEQLASKYLYFIPAAIVIALSALLLSTRPFISHHGIRWSGRILFGMVWFLASIPVGLLGGWLIFAEPRIAFDVLLFDLCVYLFVSPLAVPPELWKGAKDYVRQWKASGTDQQAP